MIQIVDIEGYKVWTLQRCQGDDVGVAAIAVQACSWCLQANGYSVPLVVDRSILRKDAAHPYPLVAGHLACSLATYITYAEPDDDDVRFVISKVQSSGEIAMACRKDRLGYALLQGNGRYRIATSEEVQQTKRMMRMVKGQDRWYAPRPPLTVTMPEGS